MQFGIRQLLYIFDDCEETRMCRNQESALSLTTENPPDLTKIDVQTLLVVGFFKKNLTDS